MTLFGTFTVRPSPANAQTSPNGAFKVYVSPAVLLAQNIENGRVCAVKSGKWPSAKPVIVQSASERIQNNIIQTSQTLQNMYGFKLGDKLELLPNQSPIPEATSIELSSDVAHPIGPPYDQGWILALDHRLKQLVLT